MARAPFFCYIAQKESKRQVFILPEIQAAPSLKLCLKDGGAGLD